MGVYLKKYGSFEGYRAWNGRKGGETVTERQTPCRSGCTVTFLVVVYVIPVGVRRHDIRDLFNIKWTVQLIIVVTS